MRLLANGEEVMFLAESSGPPRQKYWIYTVWGTGAVMVDGIECRSDTAWFSWKIAIDVELAGEWRPHRVSGVMQDTFEHVLMTLEDAGIPRGLSWTEDKVGPCADVYDMKIELAPVEWRVPKA